MSLESFINRTLNERQIQHKRVLDPENKSELQEHTYCCSNENLNSTCPITMTTFKDGDITTRLPCGHIFNTESIEEWVLHNQAKCPVCRYELEHTKEIRITPEIQYTPEEQMPHIEEPQVPMDSGLLRAFMNYILTGQNEIINDHHFTNDMSDNPIHIIPHNEFNESFEGDEAAEAAEASTPSEDPSHNNVDVVYNNINNYISMLDNIMHREIQRQTNEEDNNIMQQAILASLQNQ